MTFSRKRKAKTAHLTHANNTNHVKLRVTTVRKGGAAGIYFVKLCLKFLGDAVAI